MNGISKSILGTVAVLSLSSCGSECIPEHYIQYIEKNRRKFSKTIERNSICVTVAFMPCEYYAAREMHYDSGVSADSALKHYENSLFFILSIKPDKSYSRSALLGKDGGGSSFKEDVLRNAFNREDDIFLYNGVDTAKIVNCSHERNWGIGNEDTFLLTFSKRSLKGKLEKYQLIIRNTADELGSIVVDLCEIVKKTKKLKG